MHSASGGNGVGKDLCGRTYEIVREDKIMRAGCGMRKLCGQCKLPGENASYSSLAHAGAHYSDDASLLLHHLFLWWATPGSALKVSVHNRKRRLT